MSLEVRLPSLMFLFTSTANVLKRFPLTILAAVVATVSVIMLMNKSGDQYARLWMVAQLGLPLFTALTAFAESRKWTAERTYLLLAGGMSMLGLYFWSLSTKEPWEPGQDDMLRYLGFLLVAHLLVSFAPYVYRFSVQDFWDYNKDLFAYFITGAVFTFIIWSGLSAAIMAIGALFDVPIDSIIYPQLFALLAGLFQTVFFLHHFPDHYTFEREEISYNRVFKNLCKYILIPIVSLYFLILYVYGAKILMEWSLPHGWVSSLVIGFSVAGIFTYLLNYLLPGEDSSPVVTQYQRWFWPVLLPLVALLLLAIGTRIGDYGVTESRFFVAHIAVWLMVNGFYFVFSKQNNIKFIPISLAIFALVAVLGPFNAFEVGQKSQVKELRTLLEKNSRWANGSVKTSLLKVPEEDAARIRSVLEYLDERKSMDRIQPWFDTSLDSLPAIGSSKDRVPRILKALGISVEQIEQEAMVYASPNAEVQVSSIRGYTTYYKVDLYTDKEPPGSGYYFDITDDKQGIAWREKKGTRYQELEVFDLKPLMEKWLKECESGYYYLSDEEAVIDRNGKRAEMRLVIEQVGMLDKGNGKAALANVRGVLFLKDKQK